jgi:hypothetical protein
MVAAKQPSATSATNQGILMRKFQPSLVDWDEIAARVMAGEPTARVAQDYEISRQAIAKRAKREGWLDSQVVMQGARKNAEHLTGLKVAIRRPRVAVQPVQPEEVQPVANVQPSATVSATNAGLVQKFNKDTPEVRNAILGLLKDGVPKLHAAQAVGVHENTLNRWLNDDSGFSAEVRAAESAAVALRVQRIGKAGEKDWRADSWYLERTQRGTFGSDAGKGGGLAVQINIMRDGEPEVVDITPAG